MILILTKDRTRERALEYCGDHFQRHMPRNDGRRGGRGRSAFSSSLEAARKFSLLSAPLFLPA